MSKPENYKAIATALIMAPVGVSVAYYLKLPLPWMVGPLFLLTFLSVLGVKTDFPEFSREPVFALVGIYLGSSIAQGGSLFEIEWIYTLVFMLCFTLLATLVGYIYFKKVARYSEQEAFLSALPGALAYISVYIIENKLPPAKIILSQSIRVLLVVGLAPFIYRLVTGNTPNEINTFKPDSFALAWLTDLAVLIIASAPVIWIWLKLKAPNAWFLGGMVASMICYLSGITGEKLPTWILQVLLVFIGTMIGVRFSGTRFRDLLKYVFHGFNSSVILLILTIAVSYTGAKILSVDLIQIFLAFAPGGVHEMAIIAFAYSIEPIFVTFHHMLRIFIISFLIPILVGKFKK